MNTPKKKVKKVKVSPDVSQEKKYTITLLIADTKTQSTGATALEALERLEKPIEIVADGQILITDGTRNGEMYLTPYRIRRLFYPNAQFYAADELESIMK